MAQYSRTKKYQDLRDQIDKETTEATVAAAPRRMSRMQSRTLSHASTPVHPHDQIKSRPIEPSVAKSPVIDNLLDEVKQYNIDNGNRVVDDTQINILKSLDAKPAPQRNSHFVAMEEKKEEDLGQTMQMPNIQNDVDGVAMYMPNQKLTRINPVKTAKPKPETKFDTMEEGPKEDKIVLSSSDIVTNEDTQSEEYSLFDSGRFTDEFDRTEKQPKVRRTKNKKEPKNKASKKARKVSSDMPSAKMRMRVDDYEKASSPKQKKTGMILNTILGILIVLLLISIAFTVYFVMQMGSSFGGI